MKPDRDAYGHEIFDFHQGEKTLEIIELDDGYIDATRSPEMYFAEYDDWPEYERESMSYVRGRVLDIGCGAGRHCLYLQGKGHDVLGIDTSPLAIKVCRLRGVKKAKVMGITQLGSRTGIFDTILMLGCNFGLMGSEKRVRWLLKRFHRITNPDARIIAGSRDPYQTSNPHHLKYQKRNRRRGRMAGQLRIRVRYKTYATDWMDYLIVSREEMQCLVEGTGWQVEKYIESPRSSYIGVLSRRH